MERTWIVVWLSLLIACHVDGEEALAPKSGFVLLKYGALEIEDRDGKKRKVESLSESDKIETVVLRAGESVRTDSSTECDLVLPDAGTMRLEADSAIKLPDPEKVPPKTGANSLELLRGKLFLDVDAEKLKKGGRQFRLKTPTTILAVKGTRFFALAGDEIDTAGVHEGEVTLLEITSGKFVAIRQGNAVMAKPGAITKPRRLTAEEKSYSEVYTRFALEFSPAERANRKFTKTYQVYSDPNTAVPFEHDDHISVEKGEIINGGPSLKATILPFPKAPAVTIRASTRVNLTARLRSVPSGISFSARGNGVRRFSLYGLVHQGDGVNYGIGSGVYLDFPEGTPADEWVPFFVPIQREPSLGYSSEPGELVFGVNPNLHKGRAIPSIVEVEQGKPEYTLEISPISVGVSPRK